MVAGMMAGRGYNPAYYTYKTQRFSWIGSPQQRDGLVTTKDQRFINLYPELIRTDITDGKKYYIKKRPGLMLKGSYGVTAEGRGIFAWNGHVFAVLGNQVYQDSVPIITLTTSTGRCGFTVYNGTANYLIVLDGIQGWTISTSGVAAQITSANFPTPHIPTPVFLDGYLFVAKSGTADIYNSNLNDPFTWSASNFITAELFPDNLISMCRNANYILAFGTASIEYFFDTGTATGSPINTNTSAVLQIGAISTFSVVQTEKETIFVGTSNDGGHTVWIIDGFTPRQIAIEPIIEALDDEGASLANCTAFVCHTSGHKFYVLNLVNKLRTFIYDFEEKMWHEWQYNGTIFNCRVGTDGTQGMPLLLDFSNGNSYYLDSDFFTDNGVAITCTATTVKIDFDEVNRKFWYRFALVGDAPNGSVNVPALLYWSDDDYNTFVPTGGRTLNMNSNMMATYQLGAGRRRAFQFIYAQPYELRLEGFEVDVNIGVK